jgi:uncharacterized membrane protein required for colicin V production
MNVLLIAVLAIFAYCAFRGWRRGLLRILYSLISGILLMGLMAYATPHVSSYIKDNTGIYAVIQEKCTQVIRERSQEGLEGVSESGEVAGISLPEKVTSYIVGAGEDVLEQSGAYDAVGSKVADWILSEIAFFVSFLLALMVVRLIGRALRIVSRIPVIKGVNRILGVFAGLLQAFIIISLAFLFMALIAGTQLGVCCLAYIDADPFLSYLYYNNALLEICSYFIAG